MAKLFLTCFLGQETQSTLLKHWLVTGMSSSVFKVCVAIRLEYIGVNSFVTATVAARQGLADMQGLKYQYLIRMSLLLL